jgi:glycosyltransferase involved in cell wall biosynthesis
MIPMPKKVLHVIDSLDLGGAQTFLLDLVRHHDREHYLPELAVMHGRGVYASAFENEGITIHSLSPVKFPPMYLPNFWRLMKKGGYDILHFHLFGANLCAKPLAIVAGHPAIVVHDQCNDASREESPLLLAADAFWNRLSDQVIAVSESTRRYLLDREDLEDSKVTMIPNGIDTEMFRSATLEQKRSARLALHLAPENFVIGGVGRLVPQKNFSLFLKVAAGVARDYPEVVFLIAGTGPLESQLSAEAKTLGICDHVRFLGHVSDRVTLYHALDAMLMTSDFEGTPMTLLEAMASGVPVVASSVDGVAEVCIHGKSALLASPGDFGNFEKALSCLIEEESLRKTLGVAGRRAVVERYDIRGIARRIEEIYGEVLRGDESRLGRNRLSKHTEV